MARGRPRKKPQPIPNISGLRNQPGQSSAFTDSTPQPTPPRSWAPSLNGDESDLEDDKLNPIEMVSKKNMFINYSNKIISQY